MIFLVWSVLILAAAFVLFKETHYLFIKLFEISITVHSRRVNYTKSFDVMHETFVAFLKFMRSEKRKIKVAF